jgi:hypothetical protein
MSVSIRRVAAPRSAQYHRHLDQQTDDGEQRYWTCIPPPDIDDNNQPQQSGATARR